MRNLILDGYPHSVGEFVATAADQEHREEALAAAVAALANANSTSKKWKLANMPNVCLRMKHWSQCGTGFPEISDVAQKLLTCHATSCVTERNWSLWGRVYTSSRTALGIERETKIITICANTAQHNSIDFAVSLGVVEGLR
jgi:hypothetical protein